MVNALEKKRMKVFYGLQIPMEVSVKILIIKPFI